MKYEIAAVVGTSAGPATSASGGAVLYSIDSEQGLYVLMLDEVFLRGLFERRNGWQDIPPGPWASPGRGERAVWKQSGAIWVGITEMDLEHFATMAHLEEQVLEINGAGEEKPSSRWETWDFLLLAIAIPWLEQHHLPNRWVRRLLHG